MKADLRSINKKAGAFLDSKKHGKTWDSIHWGLWNITIIISVTGNARGRTYNDDCPLARVQNTQLLVLARGEDPGAIPVPAGAID